MAWIARDSDEELYLYTKKPEKMSCCWVAEDEYGDGDSMKINKDLFPEVKWEDEEPTEVELILKKK